MTDEAFKKKYNVRQCEKCCANCLYGRDTMCDGAFNCTHPDVVHFDMIVFADDVCDAWKGQVK